MGTKANPGKFDCYAKAEPDEPLFILLARDRWAPALVEIWTILRDSEARQLGPAELEKHLAKITEAVECRGDMKRWARGKQLETRTTKEALKVLLSELIDDADVLDGEL